MYQVSFIHFYDFTITDLLTCHVKDPVQKLQVSSFKLFGKRGKKMTRKQKGTSPNHGKYGRNWV